MTRRSRVCFWSKSRVSITSRIAAGEVADAAAELVVAGERCALRGEAGPRCAELVAAVLDVGGAALQLGQLDEAGLVEVDEAAAFGVGGVELAVQAGQFGGEQFVVGDRGACTARACSPAVSTSGRSSAARIWSNTNASRASARMLRSGQRRSSAAGADRVVVAAVVVAVPGAVAAAHLVAVGADAADPAFDQALQQPLAGFGAARAPLGCCRGDSPGGLEDLVGDDGGHRDGDPVLAGAGDLPAAAGGAPVGDRFGAVEVDPPDVGLVAQQPAQRGVRPRSVLPVGDGTRRRSAGGRSRAAVPAGGAVGEDPPHDRGLGFEHLQLRRAGGCAARDWRR